MVFEKYIGDQILAACSAEEEKPATHWMLQAIKHQSLKVVISRATIIFFGSHAAVLKNDFLNRKGKDRFCQAFLSVLYRREQAASRASLSLPKGSPFFSCSLFQKRSSSK
jgi:hypothetical protein